MILLPLLLLDSPVPLRRATRGRRAIDAPLDPDAEVIPPVVNQATPERQTEIK